MNYNINNYDISIISNIDKIIMPFNINAKLIKFSENSNFNNELFSILGNIKYRIIEGIYDDNDNINILKYDIYIIEKCILYYKLYDNYLKEIKNYLESKLLIIKLKGE